MFRIRIFNFSLVILIMCYSLNVNGNSNLFGESDSVKKAKFQLLELRSFEDNIVGYTFESDDKSFVDVTLSLRTRIFPFDYLMKILPNKNRPDLSLHFAFTGRFAQYVGTRHSNPVVEKRFNPYMFLEYRPRNKLSNLLFQLGYGHESNGQSIDDSASFYITADLPYNNIDETKDRISRGWDYVGTSVKFDVFPNKYRRLIYEAEFGIRYYLDDGFLQNGKEEYHSWERDWYGENYKRNNVAGVTTSFTCFVDSSFINKMRITFETGVEQPFRASTVKLLLGFRIVDFPVSFSYRYGYNGDLAQYGIPTHSIGIESLLPSFQRPENRDKR